MARTEARIKTSIWNDKDFLSLTPEAKFTYLTITSQGTINLAGVIALQAGGWAHATGYTRQQVLDALGELEERSYVLIDHETEELLIRTFVRHDGVLSRPNVIIAMTKDWLTIRSETLRTAVLDEIPEGFVKGLPERFPKVFGEGFPEQFPQGFWEGFTERSHARSSISTSISTSDIACGEEPVDNSYPTIGGDGAPLGARGRNDLAESLMEACGIDPASVTTQERSKINTAAKQLRDVGATRADVATRADAYRSLWPDIAITPFGIASNWSTLGEAARSDASARQEHLDGLDRWVRQFEHLPNDEFEAQARNLFSGDDLDFVLSHLDRVAS